MIIRSKEKVAEIVCVFLLSLNMLFWTNNTIIRYIIFIPMVGLGSYLYIQLISDRKINSILFTAIIVAGILNCFNYVVIKSIGILSLCLMIFVDIPCSIYLLVYKKCQYSIWMTFFCGSLLYICLRWYLSGDSNILFEGASRNYVSVYILWAIFFLIRASILSDKKISVVVFFLFPLLSTLALGRGGIIVSFFLFAIYYFDFFKKRPNNDNKRLIVVIGIVLGILIISLTLIFNSQIVGSIFSRFGSQSAKESNNIRVEIIKDYFKELKNIKSLLLGVDTRLLDGRIAIANGNLHNSFLTLHSYYGIFSFIIIFVSLFISVCAMIKQRSLLLLGVIVAFLFRAGTDYVFPNNIGDIILLYFVFYWMVPENGIKLGANKHILCIS